MISIVIEDNGEVSLKTTNGITETEIASTIVVEAMRNLKKPEPDVKSKLVLVAYDPASKLTAVKEVKEKLGLGLKEAKDLVEGAPKTVKENVPKQEAEELKKKLEAAGAKVELK